MRRQRHSAWVTYAFDENTVMDALVLARSLRRVVTNQSIATVVDPGLPPNLRDLLDQEFDFVFALDERLKPLKGMGKHDLGKLFAMSLHGFQRVAYIPSNCLVLKNCDDIFDIQKPIGVLESIDYNNNCNSDWSVFLFPPCPQHFKTLRNEWMDLAQKDDTFDHFLKTWLSNRYSDGMHTFDQSFWQQVVVARQEYENLPVSFSDGKITQFITPWNSSIPNGVFRLEDKLHDYAQNNSSATQYWLSIYYEDVQPLFHATTLRKEPNCLKLANPQNEPIAVVGISCRHPASNNLKEFWQLLIDGNDAIRAPPEYRWTKDQCLFNRSDFRKTQAGFLKVPVDEFDAKFFGISPKEVVFMDPQHRLLHEVVWEALEDSLIDPTSLRGTDGGVFMGTWRNDYVDILQRSSSMEFYRGYMGNSIGAGAARISHLLGLSGPCVATESGCSAAMVAVHLACKSLQNGETSMALACGVNLLLHPFKNDIMPMVTSSEGRCKTFDASADGFGRAEGCAVLVLKRLSDAVRDEDRIWGLIRGSAISQEGLSKSMGTPTVQCEAKAIQLAIDDAGIHPSQVSYVEMHGTGTVVGDPLEFAAIAKTYSTGYRKEPLVIGSVKTNVGHTESCSGITGIMKVILSMKHELIPPHINFKEINPEIDLGIVPAVLPLTPMKWSRDPGKPRMAGVSSFGITGTDAHVIIEEPPVNHLPVVRVRKETADRPLHIMKMTARSGEALEFLVEKYKDMLALGETQFSDIAFSANTGRATFSHRAVLIAGNENACSALDDNPLMRKECSNDAPKVCFLFTGQGCQYHGMAQRLYEACPIFQHHFDHCEKLLHDLSNISIAKAFWGDDPSSDDIDRTMYSQTGIFVVEYCLLKVWEFWGVKPDYVLGHSLGEFCAGVSAGIMSLKDAISLVAERSRLIGSLPPGKMLVVKCDKSTVDSHLKTFNGGSSSLDIAAINSSEQTVLAGDSDVVDKFANYLEKKGIKTSVLPATHAFHSHHMNPILAEYREIANKIQYSKPNVKYVSGMLGQLLDEGDEGAVHVDAEYWVNHTRQKVRFLEASKIVYNEGCRVFIEIGPHPVLLALTMWNNDGKEMVCVPSLRRNGDEWRTLLESVGKLFLNGIEINWKKFDKFYTRQKVSLPHYPFLGKKYWPDIRSVVGTQIHPLLGRYLSNPTSTKIFQSSLSLRVLEYLKDHAIGETVVFPGAAFMEMILVGGHLAIEGCAEGELTPPRKAIQVRNLRIESPMALQEDSSCVCQVVVECEEDTSGRNDDKSWDGLKVRVYHQMKPSISDGPPEADSKWIPHATGYFLPSSTLTPIDISIRDKLLTLNEMRLNFCKEDISDGFYNKLGDVGLKFGPSFRTLQTVWRGEGELLAEITVREEMHSYLVHPAILDAMIQAIMVNNYDGQSAQNRIKKKLYVPIAVEKLVWLGTLPVAGKCLIYCGKQNGTTFAVLVSDNESRGEPLVYLEGVDFAETNVKSIQALLDQQVNQLPDLWEEVYKPTLGPLQARLDIPVECSETNFERYNDVDDETKRKFNQVDRIVYHFILNAFYKLGWSPLLGQAINLGQFLNDLGLAKQYIGIVRYFLTLLEEEGVLEYSKSTNDDEWIVVASPPAAEDIQKCIKNFQETIHQHNLETLLVTSVGESLADILTGRESALNILFPKDDTKPSAEKFYECLIESFGAAREYITKSVRDITKDGQSCHLRTLEVGAGTGSLTTDWLNALELSSKENGVTYEYMYTDLSPGFFNQAEKKFEKFKKALKFKKLNIEEDPTSQGFPPGHFDLIAAFEIVHATRDVRESLSNLRTLIRDGGKIYIIETVRPVRKIHFTFGFLEGYWRFQDHDLRAHDAILPMHIWESLLVECGFAKSASFHICDGAYGFIEGRAVARMPLYPVIHSKEKQQHLPVWLLFMNNDSRRSIDIIQKFEKLQRKFIVQINKTDGFYEKTELTKNRQYATLGIDPTKKDDISKVFQFCKVRNLVIEGMLFEWGIVDDEGKPFESQDLIARPFLHILQETIRFSQKTPPKIVVLSCGNLAVGDVCVPSPSGATVLGICKSLIHEQTHVDVKWIDLDPHENCRGSQVEEVFIEIFLDARAPVAYRNRCRYLPKFQSTKIQNKDLPLARGTTRFQLVLPETRAIEDLEFGPLDSFTLKEDEIEVEVKVSALNFKDILNILKPTEEFETSSAVGFDFAGVVKGVGEGVDKVKVGDSVFGVNLNGNGLPTHIKLPAKAVVPVPENFTLEEAACFPAVFSTAFYCLVTIAQIQQGETILIHTASGGVGLCAIQLASHFGLKIIATAGSQRKRAYLRSKGVHHVFHSRNTDYAGKILNLTNGRGVDIVLNSLTSPGFKEATLEACGKNARFVEMSKLNIWSDQDVKTLRPNVKYTIVDLTKLDEETSDELQHEMRTFLKKGLIQPIPYTRFDALNIRQALQFLQKAKHIGKVICRMPEMSFENGRFNISTPLFNNRSTYLITGGLGGIGLEVAKWMSKQGAQNLVLVSRNGPSDAALEVIDNLQQRGINVLVKHANVGNFQECKHLIQSIADEKLPPLRGVMHAAGVLSDGLIENLTWEKFEDTYRAKVDGSWNLHELTKQLPLEHFVLYSSITGMFGSPGQANHTSGNCFKDSLAFYRYSRGLPATTINWGQWGQVGIAVEYDLPGIRPITTSQGLNALESIMRSQRLQTVVNNIESFTVLFKSFPHLRLYVDERAWKAEFSSAKGLIIKSDEFWEEYDACGDDREGKVGVMKNYIKVSLRHILRLDGQEPVDENMELQDMGVDSLMMLEMKNSLQSMFGSRVSVTPAALRDCSTVNKLGERLVQIVEEEGEFTSRPPPTLEEVCGWIREDSVLPECITPEATTLPATPPSQMKCILVTGATGNLGSYLLSEILRSCPQLEKIYCLIRAKNGVSPKERLRSTLERKCIPVDDKLDRVVVCIDGNFVQPKLGLSEYDYDQLSLEVEGVLHCGAKISHLEFYRKLEGSSKSKGDIRTVNVCGLLTLLEFAVNVRVKHIFNMSTIMTVCKVAEDGTMLETWPQVDAFDNMTNRGYPVSKHVCDLLLKQAVQRGIPCKSFKFPEVCGETSSGRFMLEASHYMLLHLFMMKEGKMPSVPYPANLIPVDIAAKITVEICFSHDSAENEVYLVQNPYPGVAQGFFPDLVKELGYPRVELVDFEVFMEKIINQGEHSMLFQFRDLYKDEQQFAFACATAPQNDAMRKYVENTSDFFVSKRLRRLMPEMYLGIESSYEIMKRDLSFAKKEGYFDKFGISKK